MRDIIFLILIIIALASYFFYNKNFESQYTIPSEYKGTKGLEYIRENYASELAQARNLCINQFKGDWIDTSNKIGCYNMEGFSSYYCNVDIIKNLINLCYSIGGTPTCSSTEMSCSV